MSRIQVPKKIKEKYICLLKTKGHDHLYRYIVGCGILNREKNDFPDLIYLNQSDMFFSLYRQTGDENFFEVAKALRRAAHKLYSKYCKINKDYHKSERFLRRVK